MPRPKSNDKRDRQLNVALRDDELAALKGRADARGMRLVDYARAALLGAEVQAGTEALPSRFDRLVFEQMKRIGNNLNQIARQLNALERVAPGELEECLREVRRIIREAAGT